MVNFSRAKPWTLYAKLGVTPTKGEEGWHVVIFLCTGIGKSLIPRFRELAPAGGGITQPRNLTNSEPEPCTADPACKAGDFVH